MASRRRPADDLPKPAPRPSGRPHPLQNLRVVDFTRYLAGPWCTQTLADFGADVIKIESPGGGDETRAYRPPEIAGESPYFLGLNRNKRSLVLDLRKPAGIAVAKDLAAQADIVVENFLPGAMERFGLGYETLEAANRRLIYCAVSGYGSDSSLADQPGFDSVFQAESGFLSLTGEPDRQAMRTGVPIIDIATSMNATIAVLAALAARERTGTGQRVEVALFDTAVTLLAYFSMNYLASGKDPIRQGNTALVATPIGMFEALDGGAVYVSCGTQRSWEQLAVEVLDRPDLVRDSRFATHTDRNANRAELMALLEEMFRLEPRDHWIGRARAGKVPVGAVRSVAEALGSPIALEKAIATRLAHASGEPVPNIASPFRFSETPVADPVAAPSLDQHRAEILRDVLGYDTERIASLEMDGAFGPAP